MKQKTRLSDWIEKYKDSNLLQELEENIKKEYSINIPLDQIEMNPICSKYFVRKSQISPLEIQMNKKEVMDPILVRKKSEKYQVLTGFKRYYLAKKNHFDSIPVIIRDVSDENMLLLVAQRFRTYNDENILNKAYIYDAILKLYPISRKDLSQLMDASVSQITNTLRILKLNDNVKKALKEEKITYGQARMLVGLKDEKQEEYLRQILEKNLSVRDVEHLVSLYKGRKSQDKRVENFYMKTGIAIHKIGSKVVFEFKTKEEAEEYYKKVLYKKRK